MIVILVGAINICSAQSSMTKKLNNISNLNIDQKVKLLRKLDRSLRSDSSLKINAQEDIQELLVFACNKETKIYLYKDVEKLKGLIDYYVQKNMCPQFSYEAILSIELQCKIYNNKKIYYFNEMENTSNNMQYIMMASNNIPKIKVCKENIAILVHSCIFEYLGCELNYLAKDRFWYFISEFFKGGNYHPGNDDNFGLDESYYDNIHKCYLKENDEKISLKAEEILKRIGIPISEE